MAESTLEQLEIKNKQLEGEIQTCRELFSNLTEEKHIESQDQRRAFMLKAQIYQLERQCMLLSQAQSSRAQVLNEIESQLQRITEDLRTIVTAEKSGPDVTLERSQVMDLLGTLRKLKNSLYKQSQFEASDGMRIPLLTSGSKYASTQKPLDCLDICKTGSENINLKHVATLEQDLSSLYKRLCSFSALLNTSMLPGDSLSNDLSLAETQFISPAFRRMQQFSDDCISDLKHCCEQLTTLTLLHPNAPWMAVRKSPQFDTIRFEKVMKSLPPSGQKNSQIRSTVQDFCKAHNYTSHMHSLEVNALEAQLSFCQATAKVQHRYLLELSSCLIMNYNKWKEETVDSICKPIAIVLQTWSILKENQSSENLKKFLTEFKICETELEKLSLMQSSAAHTHHEKQLGSLKRSLDEALNALEKEYNSKIAMAEEALKQHKETRS